MCKDSTKHPKNRIIMLFQHGILVFQGLFCMFMCRLVLSLNCRGILSINAIQWLAILHNRVHPIPQMAMFNTATLKLPRILTRDILHQTRLLSHIPMVLKVWLLVLESYCNSRTTPHFVLCLHDSIGNTVYLSMHTYLNL